LRHTFAIDPLACPDCGGRLRFIAVVTGHEAVTRVLAHLGEPTAATAPARSGGTPRFEVDLPPPDD
jgi:hypothetical protein